MGHAVRMQRDAKDAGKSPSRLRQICLCPLFSAEVDPARQKPREANACLHSAMAVSRYWSRPGFALKTLRIVLLVGAFQLFCWSASPTLTHWLTHWLTGSLAYSQDRFMGSLQKMLPCSLFSSIIAFLGDFPIRLKIQREAIRFSDGLVFLPARSIFPFVVFLGLQSFWGAFREPLYCLVSASGQICFFQQNASSSPTDSVTLVGTPSPIFVGRVSFVLAFIRFGPLELVVVLVVVVML